MKRRNTGLVIEKEMKTKGLNDEQEFLIKNTKIHMQDNLFI